MKSALFPIAFLASAYFAFVSLAQWRAVVGLDASSSEIRQALTPPVKALDKLRDLSSGSFSSSAANVELYKTLLSLAQSELDPQSRLKMYCEALSSIGAALKEQPYNSAFLLSWANVRQVVGKFVDCGLPYTNGNFNEAISLALSSDPTSINVQYSAALINLWSGDRDRAIELFQRVVETGVGLSAGQLEIIARSIQTQLEFEKIVPGRFPQVVIWGALLKRARPDLLPTCQQSLSKLQLKAIALSSEEIRNGVITSDIHYRRLTELLEQDLKSVVRQRADVELALIEKRSGNYKLANYLSYRRQLKELPVNRAFLNSDSRPQKSTLGLWNREGSVDFDSFYSSVGFFVDNAIVPRLLEVVSSREAPHLSLASLKIFASQDNQRWHEIALDTPPESFRLGKEFILAMRLPREHFNYWKIHYSAATRDRNISNELRRLIRVYGDME